MELDIHSDIKFLEFQEYPLSIPAEQRNCSNGRQQLGKPECKNDAFELIIVTLVGKEDFTKAKLVGNCLGARTPLKDS